MSGPFNIQLIVNRSGMAEIIGKAAYSLIFT